MATVNLPRDKQDAFYRYKMPELISKVEGRGNGIKTVIVNMTDIAKSLERPPSYPTKYFGFELGALTTIDEKADRYVVNGKHDQSKLADVLDNFIEKFLLCHACDRNPETKMSIKGGNIDLVCKACGGRTPVDMRHKLATFILKNPPPREKGDKLDKKPKSNGSSKSKSKVVEEAPDAAPAAEKPKKEKKKRHPAGEDEDDVVWFTDTSASAVEERRRQILGSATQMAAQLLVTDPVQEVAQEVAAFLAASPADAQIIDELKRAQAEHSVPEDRTVRMVFEAVFAKDTLKQLTAHAAVLKHFVSSQQDQQHLLSCIEEASGKEGSGVTLKAVAKILKALYDEEILTEEALFQWHATAPTSEAAAAVRQQATVLVDWLKTAEEESEEEEDGEEDEEEDDA